MDNIVSNKDLYKKKRLALARAGLEKKNSS